MSSAEAQRFVKVVSDATEAVKCMGELDRDAMARQLTAAEMTVAGESIRWLVGKEVNITSRGDVYGRSWDTDRYETVLDNELEREYQKHLIYLAIREGYTSVRDISKETGLDLLRVSYLLADLEKTNRVEFTGMTDSIPAFAAL